MVPIINYYHSFVDSLTGLYLFCVEIIHTEKKKKLLTLVCGFNIFGGLKKTKFPRRRY